MCQACDHPKRAALDADLRAGRPPRLVGPKYGLKPVGVYQHKMRHIDSIEYCGLPVEASPHEQAVARQYLPELIDSIESDEPCACYWCQMSGYQRLLKAWDVASTQEKDKFCAATRDYEVPF